MHEEDIERCPIKPMNIDINMKRTGENIKSLIENSPYSKKDIAKITRTESVQAVYKWCKGKSLPAYEKLLTLSILFGMDINDILVYDENIDTYDSEY